MSIDPPDLAGFTSYYGVPLCPIGDGEVVLALGHPEPMRAVAAFNRYARLEYGLRDMLDEGPTGTLAGALTQLEWRWAELLTLADCEDRADEGDDHQCEMCTELESGGWWIRWSDQPTDDSFPVVVWVE